MSFLVIDDPAFAKHAPENWPEGPQRLAAIRSALVGTGVQEALTFVPSTPATEDDLALIHTPRHIQRVKRLAAEGGGFLTLDTVVSEESFDVALLAVGGTLKAVDAVVDGLAARAAALVRPPGHHATPDEGMGFCLFNNIAIAAGHLRSRRGLSRILILDWDLHHGNGTETAFYGTPEVLFVSCHESPAYPGTGWLSDVGEGEGEGFTVNLPFPPGSGDQIYEEAFATVLTPIVRAYRPEIVLVSCGLDGHFRDPIGRLRLTAAGYGRLAEIVCRLADEICSGRVVFVLEGGYDPTGLGYSLASVLNVATGRGGPISDPSGPLPSSVHPEPTGAKARLDSIITAQRHYWPL
jgi:acetoin utilization deacetylase AcuC-like enzyme